MNRNKCNEYESLNDYNSIEPIDFQDLIGRLIIIQDFYLDDFDYINLFSRKVQSFKYDDLRFISSWKKNFDIDILKYQILNNQLLTNFKTKIINRLMLTNIEKIDFSTQNLLNIWSFEIKRYSWKIKRSDLFNDFKSLKTLDLSFYNLGELPSNIFDNLGSTLLKLDLNINTNTFYDSDIFSKLKKLTELNLIVTNKLNIFKMTLPSKLFSNIGSSLKILKISIRNINNNDLSLFYNLTNLEELNLMFLPVSKLSSNDFNNMGMKLKKLYLYSNEIERLDSKVFCKLKNLFELDLSGNHIEFLYDGIFNDLKNLEILILFNNGLKFIHKNIFKSLTNLKMIDLSKNKIEQLDSEIFQNNDKLKIILLACNKLRKIHENQFLNLNALSLLTLNHNKLDYLNHDCLKNLHNLEAISISNNNFEYLCNEYENINFCYDTNYNINYTIYDAINFEIVNHYKKYL